MGGRFKDLPPVPQWLFWSVLLPVVAMSVQNWFAFLFVLVMLGIMVAVFLATKEWIDGMDRERRGD